MTVTIPTGSLHPAHHRRLERVRAEAEKLSRWADFTQRYEEACRTTPHGDRTALRLDLGAEMGMDDRETRQALYGT